MKTALDQKIASKKVALRAAEQLTLDLSKEIAYLQIQENYALDRYYYYNNIGNTTKAHEWDKLSDKVEDMRLAKINERDRSSATESKLRDELIKLLNHSINEILQPFRNLKDRQLTHQKKAA